VTIKRITLEGPALPDLESAVFDGTQKAPETEVPGAK